MNSFISQGYPYELAGLVYYVFFLMMSRGRRAARFSQRSKVLVLLTAIVFVASVPLGYAPNPTMELVMFALGAIALISSFVDARRPDA